MYIFLHFDGESDLPDTTKERLKAIFFVIVVPNFVGMKAKHSKLFTLFFTQFEV